MGKVLNMVGGASGGGGGIELSSIAVTAPPTKTSYADGESFDPTGMVITATYSNGATRAVTGYTVSPSTLTEGMTSVTISYTEDGVTKTTTQAVSVGGFTLDVTLPAAAGTTVTATDGVTTLTETTVAGSGGNSTATFSIPNTGTWTVSAGWQYSTDTVNVVSGTSAYTSTLSKVYSELEYLGFSGTQYIDTGISGDFAGDINVTAYIGGAGCALYGARDQAANKANIFAAVSDGGGTNYYLCNTATDWIQSSNNAAAYQQTLDIEFTRGSTPTLTVNSTTISFTSQESGGVPSDLTLYVGAVHFKASGGAISATLPLTGRVSQVQFGNDGFLKAARRASDSVLGMYDTVRNQFFTNAGTGTFTAGPEV